MKLYALLVFVLLATSVIAQDMHDDDIARGEQLVADNADCSTLDNEDLVAIGEYLMEQMHPGEQHELTHQHMGIEEGTPEHDAVHLTMARTMYCGQGMMGGMMGPGMMRGTMMNYQNAGMHYGTYGMMSTWGSVLWTIFGIGVFLLVWLWVFKLWKDVFGK